MMPLKLKPAPLGIICEIVSAAEPELLRLSDILLLDPMDTEPKLRLAGVAETCPPVAPAALRGMFKSAFGALLLIARLPVTLPLDVGAKVML